jgi:transcriptional regulator with XRE-family HTH domain
MAGRPPSQEAPYFGKQLSFFRKKRGFSQEHFAEKLGIKRAMVDHYERRCTNPSLSFILKAAKTLGISIDELLGVRPSTKSPKRSKLKLKA